MKESYWGIFIIGIGVTAIMFIYFFQGVTNSDEHNNKLLKETTEAAMFDAFDLATYKATGEIRIDREKFVESFIRRFAENASMAREYKIEFYDINEEPPKVSVRVRSNESGSIAGEVTNFTIDNKIDAIMEVPY